MLEYIREKVASGNFSFTPHALTEAAVDGLSGDDVLSILQSGRIIEDYPERDRVLIHGRLQNRKHVHVVVEIEFDSVKIVTVYIPTEIQWKKMTKRRRKK